VEFRDVATDNTVAQHLIDNLGFSIRNSEPGDISFEISLGDPTLAFMGDDMSIGPFRTDYYLHRVSGSSDILLAAGMVTAVNLAKDRDSLLVSGKDWIYYLQHRIFPFNPIAYGNPTALDSYGEANFEKWPINYPYIPNPIPGGVTVQTYITANKVDVVDIVEDLLLAMEQRSNAKFPRRPVTYLPALPNGATAATTPRGQLKLQMNNAKIGYKTSYRIYPGDSTTIFDHIKKLSEQINGFEFDIIPGSREFKIWGPQVLNSEFSASKRLLKQPIYTFKPTSLESDGEIVEADWTNDGPEASVVLGLAQSPLHFGRMWYYKPSVDKFRWLDKVYDFGEIADKSLLLDMIQDQHDLDPQTKLSLTILNPEFLTPNFYTGDRPRSLIGNRIRFSADWAPYRPITTYKDYAVQALNWTVDSSGNEEVEFELLTIYEDGIAPTT
jgi:hypothetical protein